MARNNFVIKGYYFLILTLLPMWSWGQEMQKPMADKQPVDTSPLKQLGNDYQNSIKLLQNRFRIDYKVDEITMVFFREFGSRPVVLVRPDGSKIFLQQAPEKSIEWYDAATFDMIKIKNPMPGPWQAVGQILPESRVMVISDIGLNAKPLPKIIFSGEILKQTAYLTNGGVPIDYKEFRDVVSLNMQFRSTNNPNFNNFGAQPETVATFEDDGKGMDERPLDGTFTGQFNLIIPHGQWKPIFTVTTPMFTRETVGEPLVLLPNPIVIDVKTDEAQEGYHTLTIDADRERVDINSLLLDGKVKFPNGDVQNFSITEVTDGIRSHEIVNYEYGIYRVKFTAYGNTIDGRDFILDVPEYSFASEEPLLVDDTADGEALDLANMSEEQLMALEQEMAAEEEGMMAPDAMPEEESLSGQTLVMLIVGINLVIFVLGGGLIWFLKRRQSKAKEPKIPKSLQAQLGGETSPSFAAKLSGILTGLKDKLPFGKGKDSKGDAAGKSEKGSDLSGLSMPE